MAYQELYRKVEKIFSVFIQRNFTQPSAFVENISLEICIYAFNICYVRSESLTSCKK